MAIASPTKPKPAAELSVATPPPKPVLPTFAGWLGRGDNCAQMIHYVNMITLPWAKDYYGEIRRCPLTAVAFNGCSSIIIQGMGDLADTVRNSVTHPSDLPFRFDSWMDVFNGIVKYVLPNRIVGSPAFLQTAPQSHNLRDWLKTVPHEVACEFFNPNYVTERKPNDERTTMFVIDLFALSGRKSNYQGLIK